MYIQNGALAIILKDRDNVCQNIFHSACYSCASTWNQSGYSYKKSQIFPEQMNLFEHFKIEDTGAFVF